jgi:hypothetical protein
MASFNPNRRLKYDTVLLKGIAHLPVRRDFQGIDRNFHVGLVSRHRTTIDADLAREIELLHPDQRAAGPNPAQAKSREDRRANPPKAVVQFREGRLYGKSPGGRRLRQIVQPRKQTNRPKGETSQR